jgi:hypothetical protein
VQRYISGPNRNPRCAHACSQKTRTGCYGHTNEPLTCVRSSRHAQRQQWLRCDPRVLPRAAVCSVRSMTVRSHLHPCRRGGLQFPHVVDRSLRRKKRPEVVCRVLAQLWHELTTESAHTRGLTVR